MKKQRTRKWTSRIHVEKRNGLVSYCVLLSNGKSTATIRGGFSRLPVAVDDLQTAVCDAATSWLAHTQPGNGAPKPRIKRMRYVRAHYQPVNRQHREHRNGRRAA